MTCRFQFTKKYLLTEMTLPTVIFSSDIESSEIAFLIRRRLFVRKNNYKRMQMHLGAADCESCKVPSRKILEIVEQELFQRRRMRMIRTSALFTSFPLEYH